MHLNMDMVLNIHILRSRDAPCAPAESEWNVPDVSQSVTELFERGNWSVENPSPLCECSCGGRKRMLPECPPGAGGLPPPQVGDLYKAKHE